MHSECIYHKPTTEFERINQCSAFGVPAPLLASVCFTASDTTSTALDCGQYLVQYFLQEGGSHAISHVSVGWMGEKKLSLCSQSCLDVLLAIYVLLTSVHHTNVTCESGARDQMVSRM